MIPFFCLHRRDVTETLQQPAMLYQSTHANVASSTSDRFFQILRCITSDLYNPLMLSAIALSFESPVLPVDASNDASCNLCMYASDTY
ncbi:hypothetical protein PEC301619_43020 [Pectobacterium carotovorum subsp. carotovorum]|nr:hypothetical protein PEC301619_43020 [Pectobacterium carotovorum subsp. carotovorum]